MRKWRGAVATKMGRRANVHAGRAWLVDEDLDRDDPWQFKNMRVN